MFVSLTLAGKDGTTIYINVEHIVSFSREVSARFTAVHCVGGVDPAVYMVTETPDEILELIGIEED